MINEYQNWAILLRLLFDIRVLIAVFEAASFSAGD
jgi:hypothetical protein